MTSLLVFAVVGLGTYASRSVFILGVGDRELDPRFERALRNIGPAVLASLTASLLTQEGVGSFLTDVPVVAGCLACISVGVWRRSFLAAFGAALVTWLAVGGVT